jgi:hypothetical protein
MIEQIGKALPVIIPVSLLTGLAYLALPRLMLDRPAVEAKGMAAAAAQQGVGFVVGSAIFGALIVILYLWVGGRWPGMETEIFVKLGILTFAGFTLLAIVACPLMSTTGRIPIYTLMNLVWAVGYGWFLPHLLK